jgi:hypothetical protein
LHISRLAEYDRGENPGLRWPLEFAHSVAVLPAASSEIQAMYETLFTPAKIGRMWVKNRIVRAPNTTLYASPKEGTVSQLLLDHYAVEAAGGCGLCMVEASSVDVNSRLQYGEPTLLPKPSR